MRYLVLASLTVLTLHCFPSPARAELLWDDTCDVRDRVQTLIRKHLSPACARPKAEPVGSVCTIPKEDGLFGYQDVRESYQPHTIAVEIVVRTDTECFDKLTKDLESLIAQKANLISTRQASDLFSEYGADGGPTLIFYFPATDSELQQVNHPIH
jgi:hypothetical protein